MIRAGFVFRGWWGENGLRTACQRRVSDSDEIDPVPDLFARVVTAWDCRPAPDELDGSST